MLSDAPSVEDHQQSFFAIVVIIIILEFAQSYFFFSSAIFNTKYFKLYTEFVYICK